MERIPLFNPTGSDLLTDRKIIGGNPTNLFNLNSSKYTWAVGLYKLMRFNQWFPDKVDMSQDITDYKQLSDYERNVFDNIISFLSFLDSLQFNNLPHIADYITAPEIKAALQAQAMQETIHSESYQYILESVVAPDSRDSVLEMWRTNEDLKTRNTFIADIYNQFWDSSNKSSFANVLFANYLLEGLYFYNGFNFFYSLAFNNKMRGTSEEIRYIHRDENSHRLLFSYIIKGIKEENPSFFDTDACLDMIKTAVEHEISWTNSIIPTNLLGINPTNTSQYSKYLANNLLIDIGLDPIYSSSEASNPYSHLDSIANLNQGSIKSNFFESTVTNYSQASAIKGWDLI